MNTTAPLHRPIHILLFLTFLSAPLLHAQYDLHYFLSHAYESNPAILENKNLAQIENLEMRRMSAMYKAPNIYLSSDILFAPYFNNGKLFSTNPQPNAIGYDIGITNGGLYSGLVNAQLPIINNRRYKIFKESAGINVRNNIYKIELVKHTLKKSVTDQYLHCSGSYQQMQSIQEITRLLSDQKEIVDKLVRNGMLNQSDFILLSIEYATQMANLRQLQADYKGNLMLLNNLCGINDTNTVILSPLLLELYSGQTQNHLMEPYTFDSLKTSIQQKIFDSKYLPQVNIFSNAGLNAVSLAGLGNKIGLSAGLGFTWTIFDGKQKKIVASQIRLKHSTIATKKHFFAQQTQLQMESDLQQLKIIDQKIQLLEQQSEDFQDLLEIYKIQLEKGQLSVIDYINTLKAYKNIQTTIIISKTNKQLLINDYNYWNW